MKPSLGYKRFMVELHGFFYVASGTCNVSTVHDEILNFTVMVFAYCTF